LQTTGLWPLGEVSTRLIQQEIRAKVRGFGQKT